MKLRWKKLGCLYNPQFFNQHPKLLSHAANPVPIHLSGDVYRIFFNGRDDQNRSSVGAVDINIVDRKIVEKYDAPFFEHGNANTYFSYGISLGNYYLYKGNEYLSFMGWEHVGSKHWKGNVGNLSVTPTRKLSLTNIKKPLLSTDTIDPLNLSYPWIEATPKGTLDMWYGSTLSWDAGNGEQLHTINHASSLDGIAWSRSGAAIPYIINVAQAFSKPSVFTTDDKKEMWFSYRGKKNEPYRIGYASSIAGSNWVMDLAASGIGLSERGWDSEMVAYPYVFLHKNSRYMLYCGNGFGKTGFGLAICESQ